VDNGVDMSDEVVIEVTITFKSRDVFLHSTWQAGYPAVKATVFHKVSLDGHRLGPKAWFDVDGVEYRPDGRIAFAFTVHTDVYHRAVGAVD